MGDDKNAPTMDWYKRQIKLVVLLTVVAVAISHISLAQPINRPFISSESKFTDASGRGLAIVPASCPSDPHYSGQCDGGTGGGDDPPVPSTGCVLYADPRISLSGQPVTLMWNTACGESGCTVNSPRNGSIDQGIGSVPPSGQTVVRPQTSTLYTYSGRYSSTGSVFSCSRSVTVCSQGQVILDGRCASSCPSGFTLDSGGVCRGACPDGYTLFSGQCVPNTCRGYYCVGDDLYFEHQGLGSGNSLQCLSQKIQTCGFGCAGSACLAPPSPDLSITARPSIVQRGNTVVVEWSSTNTKSCTVTGDSGDSWVGIAGQEISRSIDHQTKFTLDCVSKHDNSHYSKFALVNIIPNFEEPCQAGYHHQNGECVAD